MYYRIFNVWTKCWVVKRNLIVILEIGVLSRKLHLKSSAKCIQFCIRVIFQEIIFLCIMCLLLFSHRQRTTLVIGAQTLGASSTVYDSDSHDMLQSVWTCDYSLAQLRKGEKLWFVYDKSPDTLQKIFEHKLKPFCLLKNPELPLYPCL